jgi:hypothetical protein
VPDDLTLRPVEQDEWPDAMRLAARSFLNEPFMVEMFGAEPFRRFALSSEAMPGSAASSSIRCCVELGSDAR